MKKYLIVSIMAFIMIMPIAGASNVLSTNKIEEKTPTNFSNENFTHTVFVEYGTLTTCGPCVTASSQLYSIYNSGDLNFYYVSLVADEGNRNVLVRLKELGVTGVPDVYFDGGYKRILGGQTNEDPYRNAITQSGEREVPDIDIDVDVTWMGGGKLKIAVTVVNNEVEEFSGHIRTYIVEKESRWNDNSGKPYHYAVLGIPIDRSLAVVKSQPKVLGDTYTFKKTWFGSLFGFGDITKENTMVIAAVFDKDTDYVVETAAAEPTAASGKLFQFVLSRPIMQLFRLMREQGILFRLLQLM
ncbi:MAG: hypothetical protein JSW60_07795 [Thermoplasmatales archaeon]|nr:MAG: hypothetical protein JSW60_07795 [Thermoplasmatales archaeon]